MDVGLYSVRDLKSGSFQPPFAAVSEGTALRMCKVWKGNPESLIAQFPEDFDVYCVGSFSEDTGMCAGSVPVFVCHLIDL